MASDRSAALEHYRKATAALRRDDLPPSLRARFLRVKHLAEAELMLRAAIERKQQRDRAK